MKPKQRRQSQTKPRTKQRPNQPQQITEHRNRRRDQPSQRPSKHTQSDPGAQRPERALSHNRLIPQPAPPDPDIHILHHNRRVYDAGDDDGRHGDAPGCFRDDRGRGSQGGRGHVVADVGVNYHGHGDVEGYGCGLQQDEGFGEVGWFLHFGDEAEEGDVAAVGDYDVGDADGAGGEGGFARGCDEVGFWVGRVLDADAYHCDYDCGCDGETGCGEVSGCDEDEEYKERERWC